MEEDQGTIEVLPSLVTKTITLDEETGVTTVTIRDKITKKLIRTFRSHYGAAGPRCPVCGEKIGARSCLLLSQH
jgi:hypothetical protein